MKFENITRLKIDCPKHGKSGTELLIDGDVLCTKCYREFERSEERKIKMERIKKRIQKKRIQEPILFTWYILLLLFSVYIISSTVVPKIIFILYVIVGYGSVTEIIRILKERKPNDANVSGEQDG